MKKQLFLIGAFFSLFNFNAKAADLIEVYQQALTSDPVYQQIIAQQFAIKEGFYISLSSLLPQIAVTANPSVQHSIYSGAQVRSDSSPPSNTQRAYTLALTINQTIFDAAQFANTASALATSKEASATINAALQSLIVRVASAYFAVLKAEDNLSYAGASKRAYEEQLDQVKQQYEVGVKTITDVYTAKASYDSASADFIAAETVLANERENLRVITGRYYPNLATLGDFPLVTPEPTNVEAWVGIAAKQNWTIKAQQHAVDAARNNVRQQFAGHLPNISVQGTLDRSYYKNINSTRSVFSTDGASSQTDRMLMVNVNVPLFAGGGVVALTNQAKYNFQAAQQQLEQTFRNTLNNTRQSYLGIVSGISQIAADQQAIKSTISSLEGMEESYKVGTETLVNVLNQQQKVFEARTNFAADRYAFVNNVLALKQAAGTLSFDDLRIINSWLKEKREKEHQVVRKKLKKSKKQIYKGIPK